MTGAGEPGQHRAEPIEQGEHRLNVSGRGQTEGDHCLESGGRLRGLASRGSKAGQAIGALAAGGFGNAEVCAEQSATELIRERRVSTRQTPGNRVAEFQRLARDMKGIKPMMVKRQTRSLHLLVVVVRRK